MQRAAVVLLLLGLGAASVQAQGELWNRWSPLQRRGHPTTSASPPTSMPISLLQCARPMWFRRETALPASPRCLAFPRVRGGGLGRHMWIARHAHCRPAAAAPLPTTSGLRPPAPTDSPSRPPARRADALQEALGKCIIGYTPDVFLQPSQTICLPTWYDACRYVSISGELPPAVAGWGGGCKPRLLGCLLPAGHLQPGGCASQCLQCTAPPRTCGRPSCFRPPTATPRG